MAKCEVCGLEVALPFRCRYCSKLFCSEHRLPESHSCEKIEEVEPPAMKGTEAPTAEPQAPPTMMRGPVVIRVKRAQKISALQRASTVVFVAIFAVFAIQLLAEITAGHDYFRYGDYRTFIYYIGASPATALERPWTVFTSILAHADIAHFLVNAIVFFSFAPMLEVLVGKRKFLLVFFGAGAIATVVQLLVIPHEAIVVGASGGILGILGVLTMLMPKLRVLLFFFIPLPLWVATLGFAGLSAILAVTAPGSSIASAAHLVGTLVGLGSGWLIKMRREEYSRTYS